MVYAGMNKQRNLDEVAQICIHVSCVISFFFIYIQDHTPLSSSMFIKQGFR